MISNLATQKMIQALKEQIMKEQFDEKYPVGNGHYIQFQGMAEPSVAFAKYGATWQIDTDYTGRMLVGSGTGFPLSGEGSTGGNEKHHHAYSVAYSEFYGALVGTDSAIQLNEQWESSFLQPKAIPRNPSLQTSTTSEEVATRVVWGNTEDTPSLSPYKVVAVWKRTE